MVNSSWLSSCSNCRFVTNMNQLLSDIEKAFLLLAECTHNVENCRATIGRDKFLGELKTKKSTALINLQLQVAGRNCCCQGSCTHSAACLILFAENGVAAGCFSQNGCI